MHVWLLANEIFSGVDIVPEKEDVAFSVLVAIVKQFVAVDELLFAFPRILPLKIENAVFFFVLIFVASCPDEKDDIAALGLLDPRIPLVGKPEKRV